MIHKNYLLLPEVGLLFLCLLFLGFAGNNSLACIEAINTTSAPVRSVTLKFTMPDGTWIKATEAEGGQIVIRRKQTVLTLSPRFIGENRVGITLRLVGNLGVSKVFEDSIEIENNTILRPCRELTRAGLPFDLTIAEINRVGVALNPVRSSGFATSDSGACCISCSGVTACACAVEAPCGSCCAGSCCT